MANPMMNDKAVDEAASAPGWGAPSMGAARSTVIPGVPIDDAREVSRCVAAIELGVKRLRGGLPIGAFGGREDVSLQMHLLLAARVLKAPVRMVWDRAESIRGHGKRHPFRIRHTLGADRQGRLVAARIDLLADAGLRDWLGDRGINVVTPAELLALLGTAELT